MVNSSNVSLLTINQTDEIKPHVSIALLRDIVICGESVGKLRLIANRWHSSRHNFDRWKLNMIRMFVYLINCFLGDQTSAFSISTL